MANSRVCSIPECDKQVQAKGYCNGHYHRLRRHRDPLAGGPSSPRGEAARYFREVVIPYKGDECLIWPYSKGSGGYGQIGISGATHIVSRLVCVSAHGAPPTSGHEAAHSCGNGSLGCVNPHHMSWKTRAANQADRIEHGTSNRGERCGKAKLTEDNVRFIRLMRRERTQLSLSRQFNVSLTAIRAIQAGRKWSWLD